MARTRVPSPGAAAARPTGAGPSVFVCYRRDDTGGHAGRLYDRLSERFGAARVFIDVDTIEPGEDFVDVIDSAVGHSDVCLVLIGHEWLTSATGERRLDDPNDFVRMEVAAALRKNARLIPVLVEDADMPHPEELPPELRPLTRRNALPLSNARWRYDTDRLLETIERVTGRAPARVAPGKPYVVQTRPRPRLPLALRIAVPIALAAGAAAAAIALLANGSGPAAPTVASIAMPAVAGLDTESAVDEVRRAGFEGRIVPERHQNEADPGIVYDQDPNAGAKVDPASTVTLYISAGSGGASTIAVPSLVDRAIDEALAELDGLGLDYVLKEQKLDGRNGIVLAQDPPAGTRLAPTESVTLTYSVGGIVPAVEGMTQADAETAATDAGYGLEVAGSDPTGDETADGTVARQDPPAGTETDGGTISVRLWSYGPIATTVPGP